MTTIIIRTPNEYRFKLGLLSEHEYIIAKCYQASLLAQSHYRKVLRRWWKQYYQAGIDRLHGIDGIWFKPVGDEEEL
jgi:hypothetical protein